MSLAFDLGLTTDRNIVSITVSNKRSPLSNTDSTRH